MDRNAPGGIRPVRIVKSVAPSDFDPNEVLYYRRLHFKYFLKRSLRASFVAAVLITLLVYLQYQLTTLPDMNYGVGQTLQLESIPSQWMTGSIAFLVGFAAFAVYRTYYEWQRTFIEVTWMKVSVYRPNNRLLFIRNADVNEIGSEFVGGFETNRPTVAELFFFKHVRTATVKTVDLEGQYQSPIRDLTDVNDYELLRTQISRILKRRLGEVK